MKNEDGKIQLPKHKEDGTTVSQPTIEDGTKVSQRANTNALHINDNTLDY